MLIDSQELVFVFVPVCVCVSAPAEGAKSLPGPT